MRPPDMVDWQGRAWTPSNGPAAQPNSRYTVPAQSGAFDFPALGGSGRRADFRVYFWRPPRAPGSAGVRSDELAARRVRRRDDGVGNDRGRRPARWASRGAIRWPCFPSAATTWPIISATGWKWAAAFPIRRKIFHVNWFRKGADGKFLWPGYGENVRVLKWMLERIEGKAAATETPIGVVPAANALTLDGLDVSRATMEELLRVDPADWAKEHADVGNFFQKFGDRLPDEIRDEHDRLGERLQRIAVVPK